MSVPNTPADRTHANSRSVHVVFSGGGTGGHLFPGIAVATELVRLYPAMRITFVGRGSAFERGEVEKAGFEFKYIDAKPLPRRPWHAVGFITNQVACAREASRFLKREQVSLVIGLGGYASVPVARCAASQGIPLVLMEQNRIPGRANRWLSSSASLVCSAFEVTVPWKCDCPVRVTGNPVRRGFIEAHGFCDAPEVACATHQRRVVILGGSQGAQSLNEQVPRALYKVGRIARDWQIIHQSGQVQVDAVRTLYRKLGLTAQVHPFVHNLPAVLAATDLVISRAGGTTLAELAASATPALLIPYPHATNDHQRQNADLFVMAGAALLVDVRDASSRLDNRVAEVLRDLMDDRITRTNMSNAMRNLARPKAGNEIALAISALIGATARRQAS